MAASWFFFLRGRPTTIKLSAIGCQATLVAPTIGVGIELSIPVLAAQASLVAPAIGVGTELSIPVLAAQATLVEPTIGVGIAPIAIDPVRVSARIVAPLVSLDVLITLAPLRVVCELSRPRIVWTGDPGMAAGQTYHAGAAAGGPFVAGATAGQTHHAGASIGAISA